MPQGSPGYAPQQGYTPPSGGNYAGGYQPPQYQSGGGYSGGGYAQGGGQYGGGSYAPYTNYAPPGQGSSYGGGTYQPPQYQQPPQYAYGGGYTPPSGGGYYVPPQGGGGAVPSGGSAVTPSQALLNFVVGQEGFNPNPYPDGTQTSIGFGTRYTGQVTPPISRATGMQLLLQELENAARYVSNAVSVSLSQNQFDALVDFEYNTGAIGKVAAFLNAGNVQAALDKLNEYIHQGGVVLQDLVKRRAAEIQMFVNGTY